MKISNFKSREKQRVEAFNVSPQDIESEIEEMNEFIRDLEAANANKVSIRNVIEYTHILALRLQDLRRYSGNFETTH